MMTLSIVLCTHNRANQLSICLTKLAQVEPDRKDIELVIVDNASTDHTPQVIEAFMATAPFVVRTCFEPQPGVSRAKNKGILLSTGDLIFFLDDDCYPELGFFGKLENAVAHSGFDYGGGQILPNSPDLDDRVAQMAVTKTTVIPPNTPVLPPGFIQGASMFFRRHVFEKTGFFNVNVGAGTAFPCEDIEMVTRASRAGFLGGQLPGFTVYHDHGRLRGSAEAEETVHGYNRGRGAYFAGLLHSEAQGVWPFWWEFSYIHGRGSHLNRLRRLCVEMRGAVEYLETLLPPPAGQTVLVEAKNQRKKVHAFIICWHGFERNAAKIAENLLGRADFLTVVYSTKDGTQRTGPGQWQQVPDEWFFGKKFEAALRANQGDVLLLIHADTYHGQWAGVLDKCRQAFEGKPNVGVWAPEIDLTHWPIDKVKLAKWGDSNCFSVAQTDCTVMACAWPVVERLKQFDYSQNNLGHGIDWAAIAYAYSHNMQVLMDTSVRIHHQAGTGYDKGQAVSQMQAFMAQLSTQEQLMYEMLKASIERNLQAASQTKGAKKSAKGTSVDDSSEEERLPSPVGQTAYLFLAHTFSEDIAYRFLDFWGALSQSPDCCLLLDAANQTVVDQWAAFLKAHACAAKTFIHTAEQLEKQLGYPCLKAGNLMPGSGHFPLVQFARSNPYAHYWVVEFDVHVTVPWPYFFSLFDHVSADLLCSHLTTYAQSPHWTWWGSLSAPTEQLAKLSLLKEQLAKGFFPIYRASAQAVAACDHAHQQGWRGHMEVLWPVLGQVLGLTVEDFNQFGNLYSSGAQGLLDGPAPYATLRWRPQVQPQELMDNADRALIYHPIKSDALTFAPQALAVQAGQLASAAYQEAIKQMLALRGCPHSPWRRAPQHGFIRGIDFYTPSTLMQAMGNAMQAYRLAHGVYPDIVTPQNFNEKIFWVKFFGEIKVPASGNKLETQAFIPEAIRDHVRCPDIVWQSLLPALPENDDMPAGVYYLKASHGSGMFQRVTFPISPTQRAELEAMSQCWLATKYGLHDGEWWYSTFTPAILLERSVQGDTDSIGWNFYVLNGQVPMVGLYRKHADGHNDSTWLDANMLPLPNQPSLPAITGYVLPPYAHQMFDWAKQIAAPFSAVRVDFINGEDGKLYLGELTFSPGNALNQRHPEIDRLLSEPWKILK
jgi:glycosyltransferase involved in cell wall biosynthesis